MPGLRLAGRASGPQRDVVAARPLRRATRIGHGGVHLGRRVCRDRSCRRMRRADARDRYLIAGPFSTHTPLEPLAVAGDVTYSFDPEAIRFEPSRIFTEDTYVAFEGATGVRRAIEDAVPRHQPQLAGERSIPGRHHDRVRRADARDSDRRRRQVRWRHAGRVPPAAHRGPLHRLGNARVGRELGRHRRRLRRREFLRQHQPRGDSSRTCRAWT